MKLKGRVYDGAVKIRQIHSLAIVSLLLLSSIPLAINNSQNNVFAQIPIPPNPPPSTPSKPQPNIFFTSIYVDANPVPNKPFKITAYIQSDSINWSTILAYITAPQGINVVSPIFATMAPTTAANTESATWTVMAGSTGSYPIVITAMTNFPADTETFNLTVNVGSPHSLVVTGVKIPGNIFLNDNFTVGIKLKNTASVQDNNVIVQVFAPAGLQLLDNVTQYIPSINPNQELQFNWKINAQNVGSSRIYFNFTSTNAGPNYILAAVNVGAKPPPTGALLSMVASPVTLQPNSINPIVLDITNKGIQEIHNLQIVSASGGGYTSVNTPLWIGDLGNNARRETTLQVATTNQSLPLQIPILVRYDSGGKSFNETYATGLQLGNQPDFKIQTVRVSPSLSYAGDIGHRIDVQIFNAGLVANNVYTTLNLPDGLTPAWGNATSVYFGKIDTFQTVTASYYINIDSKLLSGNYPMYLSIATGQQNTKLNLNYVVSPKAIFNLISADYSQLYPGAANVPFKITMKNVGTAPAQTIITKLLSGNAVPGIKSNSLTVVGNQENIGTVLPDQIFTTTFFVNLDPTFAAGDQSTTVEIDWTQNWTQNGTNNFVQTVTIPYHVANGPYYLLYYGSIPWTYMLIAALFGLGLYTFLKKRRKRMKILQSALLQERAMFGTESLEFQKVESLEDISAEKKNVVNRSKVPSQKDSKETNNEKENLKDEDQN